MRHTDANKLGNKFLTAGVPCHGPPQFLGTRVPRQNNRLNVKTTSYNTNWSYLEPRPFHFARFFIPRLQFNLFLLPLFKFLVIPLYIYVYTFLYSLRDKRVKGNCEIIHESFPFPVPGNLQEDKDEWNVGDEFWEQFDSPAIRRDRSIVGCSRRRSLRRL